MFVDVQYVDDGLDMAPMAVETEVVNKTKVESKTSIRFVTFFIHFIFEESLTMNKLYSQNVYHPIFNFILNLDV